MKKSELKQIIREAVEGTLRKKNSLKIKLKQIVNEEVRKAIKEYRYADDHGKYATIVFLQNSQDFEDFSGSGGQGLDGFFDSDKEEMVKYLSQWDYGNYDDVREDPPWGKRDNVSKVGEYILSVNSSLGYAGLYIQIDEEWDR